MKIFIYSGDCRWCQTGLPTMIIDDIGKELRTGDVVIAYTVAKNTGIIYLAGLSAVVANHYDNIHGFPPKECLEKNKGEPFIMGIKTCDIQEPEENYPKTVWRVHRVKSFNEVIPGEKWDDYGFNYREEEN